MVSANCSLMPSRALQTWQIRLDCLLSNLTICFSPKPISRSRTRISGAPDKCLTQTTVPALTWLKGQTVVPAHSPSTTTTGFRFSGLLIARQNRPCGRVLQDSNDFSRLENARGLAHSRTLSRINERKKVRQVLECASLSGALYELKQTRYVTLVPTLKQLLLLPSDGKGQG
jgi:hypothetical protein